MGAMLRAAAITATVLSRVESRKYFVVTSNDSGSSWFCNLLNHQPNTVCGGEVLIKLSHKDIDFKTWRKATDEWFEAESRPDAVVGFKLMYYQTPREMDLFFDYVVTNRIAILHLVREAAVLRLIPDFHTKGRIKNEAIAVELQQHTRLWSPGAGLRGRVEHLENENEAWRKKLQLINVEFTQLAYEHLLVQPHCHAYLDHAVRFINPTLDHAQRNWSYFRSHGLSCQSRIDRYDDLVRHQLKGTKTYAACDLLNVSSPC